MTDHVRVPRSAISIALAIGAVLAIGVAVSVAVATVAVATPNDTSNDTSEDDSAGAADPGERLFRLSGVDGGITLVTWSPAAVRADARERFVVPGFPLRADLVIDLELERFRVTGAGTRFVIGRRGRPDRQLDFDPSNIVLLRGRVTGRSGSHLFLALRDGNATGSIDFGPGGERYRIASTGAAGESLEPGTLSVFRAEGASAMPPGVPLCGNDDVWEAEARDAGAMLPGETVTDRSDAGESTAAGWRPDSPKTGSGFSSVSVIGPARGLKQLELAVDTDFEFFSLFGDLDAAAAYLTVLYAQVSDIYLRDAGVRVELVFARLWDDPDDLFNDVDPSPLRDFRDHWEANLGAVHRDVAQLLSGRRDYPFGGQAWLSSLCSSFAYSVVGYALGFFPDPALPSPYHYDIGTTAHEIGHNAGTRHTHDFPNNIDDCQRPAAAPQRGTIMSYCGQTYSGMNANQDLYFHSRILENIAGYVGTAACLADDCNMNGVDDSGDVDAGTSVDSDANGVPDECEDCNGNLVLDLLEGLPDRNGNLVPDICEPDCNGSGFPDEADIEAGTSEDLYGNRVPDECEIDCNGNGSSDYNEIQADMSRDVDRDRALDTCADCDADGRTDLHELNGAHGVWVTSGRDRSLIREFHATSGVLTQVPEDLGDSLVRQGQDLLISPLRQVLVSSALDNRVMKFSRGGRFLGNLVRPGAGGLAYPTGLALGPDGTVLVASRDTDRVLAYDLDSGAFRGAFVEAGAGGLVAPFGISFGPNGNLFVSSGANEILEYDGADGAFIRRLVTAVDNGGLEQPRGLVFKPDGNLLVASYGTDELLEFDGRTGESRGPWARVGTASRLTKVSPWGVRIGPNGNVFMIRTGEQSGSGSGDDQHDDDHGDEHEADQDVGGDDGRDGQDDDDIAGLHLTNASIYEFDVRNGNFIRTYVGGSDHGLRFPTGFDFIPGWNNDCNMNLLPDECDIASGASRDENGSRVPDECEIDCNGNGRLDRLDIIPYGNALDCNFNLLPDSCDIGSGGSADCDADGVPDECEADCDDSGAADICEILAGEIDDCDGNGVPDLCDVDDNLETAAGWIAGAADDDATGGLWERVDPIGTVAQPARDHTPGAGRFCYATGQGLAGGDPDDADVDGGRTTLLSPGLAIGRAADPAIGYWRWYSNGTGAAPGDDVLEVDISNDGGASWSNVEIVGPGGPEAAGGWFFHLIRVADFVEPTDDVRLRFVAADRGEDSTIEAAIDDLVVAVDTTPPAIAVTLDVSILWPPNHRMVDITAAVETADACGPVEVVLSSVTSSEADDAPGTADGETMQDIQDGDSGAADLGLRLRAERDGNGPGRTYTMRFTAEDRSGNVASDEAIVFVPHDQGEAETD